MKFSHFSCSIDISKRELDAIELKPKQEQKQRSLGSKYRFSQQINNCYIKLMKRLWWLKTSQACHIWAYYLSGRSLGPFALEVHAHHQDKAYSPLSYNSL